MEAEDLATEAVRPSDWGRSRAWGLGVGSAASNSIAVFMALRTCDDIDDEVVRKDFASSSTPTAEAVDGRKLG